MLPVLAPEACERLLTMATSGLPGLFNGAETAESVGADERFSFYSAVLSSEPTLFGRGIGAFGDYAHRSDEYVHNLFLEAYFETGIVGLLLLSWAVLGGFRALSRAYWSTCHDGILFCLIVLVFYFVEAQFSGTLLGNKGLLPFLLLGYCVAGGKYQRGRPGQRQHAIPQNFYAVPRIS